MSAAIASARSIGSRRPSASASNSLEIAARHVLGRDEGPPPVLAGGDDRHQVRVHAELLHRLRLEPGPGQRRLGHPLGVEDPDRGQGSVALAVTGEVHALAGALTEEADHLEAAAANRLGGIGGERCQRRSGGLDPERPQRARRRSPRGSASEPQLSQKRAPSRFSFPHDRTLIGALEDIPAPEPRGRARPLSPFR